MQHDIGTVPEGWYVVWCEVCLLSVTVTGDDVDSYGANWPAVLTEACAHEHPDGSRAP